tara:strand:+ start:3931 stop:4248 length:318 start_codon:yes stop_codon:yes gene_type:complete
MEWSSMNSHALYRGDQEQCDKLGMVIEYKGTTTLAEGYDPTVFKRPILARISRYKGVRKPQPNVYKVEVREWVGKGAFVSYYLFDSSLAEAKNFAEALVEASYTS